MPCAWTVSLSILKLSVLPWNCIFNVISIENNRFFSLLVGGNGEADSKIYMEMLSAKNQYYLEE